MDTGAAPTGDQLPGLRWAIRERHFVLRFHGFVEMKLEELTIGELADAGRSVEVLEEYPDRPQGFTKLLLAQLGDRPVHLVVNVSEFHEDPSYPIAVVTVYEPESPYWIDERTRGEE